MVVEHLVASIGIYKAVCLRSVSKAFDSAVVHAICNSQIIDINDPATPDLNRCMSPPLKGRILLSKSRSDEATGDKVLFVIASVNRALDDLTQPTEGEQVKQHQIIAESASHQYPGYSWQIEGGIEDIDEKVEVQNVFSGAIALGAMPLVKTLLWDRASPLPDVNRESPYFGRPLQIAASWGHVGIVRYLIACGADPRASSSTSWGGDDKDWELNTDCEPNTDLYIGASHVYRSPEGSALRAAVLSGHEDIVRLLLQPEYRLSLAKTEYLRAVVAGSRAGRLDLIELLLQKASKTVLDFPGLGEVMLWEAAGHNQQGVVGFLLKAGVHVNAAPHPDCLGHGCAMSIAASQGNAPMVRFLLGHGADACFSHVSQNFLDPIEIAARHGHKEVVELLLEQGADPARAFIKSADGGQVSLVKRLLRLYPDLHTQRWIDERTVGMWALERAIYVKNPDVIRLMVEVGVPLNEGYSYDDLPIVLAKLRAADWVVDLLLLLGARNEEVIIDRRDDIYDEEHYPFQLQRGGVRITRRTWEWVSRY
ncbi:MAG: hypothetical protein M1821_000930 [Bathelium mastoideum]|nr:MAG: hypothetical protein M1821_000930 [Bathelium mastoideum]